MINFNNFVKGCFVNTRFFSNISNSNLSSTMRNIQNVHNNIEYLHTTRLNDLQNEERLRVFSEIRNNYSSLYIQRPNHGILRYIRFLLNEQGYGDVLDGRNPDNFRPVSESEEASSSSINENINSVNGVRGRVTPNGVTAQSPLPSSSSPSPSPLPSPPLLVRATSEGGTHQTNQVNGTNVPSNQNTGSSSPNTRENGQLGSSSSSDSGSGGVSIINRINE